MFDCTRREFIGATLAGASSRISKLRASMPAAPPHGGPGQSVQVVTPMPLAERIRRHAVPERGMCSILPAQRPVDGLLSGNGKMYVEIYGDPLSEHVVFHQERLVKPWVGRPLVILG